MLCLQGGSMSMWSGWKAGDVMVHSVVTMRPILCVPNALGSGDVRVNALCEVNPSLALCGGSNGAVALVSTEEGARASKMRSFIAEKVPFIRSLSQRGPLSAASAKPVLSMAVLEAPHVVLVGCESESLRALDFSRQLLGEAEPVLPHPVACMCRLPAGGTVCGLAADLMWALQRGTTRCARCALACT